jgi:hypothetical protein
MTKTAAVSPTRSVVDLSSPVSRWLRPRSQQEEAEEAEEAAEAVVVGALGAAVAVVRALAAVREPEQALEERVIL